MSGKNMVLHDDQSTSARQVNEASKQLMSQDFELRNRTSFIPQSGMSELAISDCNLLNSTARQSHRLQPLDDEEENVIIGESPFEVVP